jgi:hypothetical protein
MRKPSTNTSVVHLSKPYHVIHASHEFACYLGYSPEELNGRSLAIMQSQDIGSCKCFEEIMEALESGKCQESGIKIRRRDHSPVCVKIKAITTETGKDNIFGVISIMHMVEIVDCSSPANLPDITRSNMNTELNRPSRQHEDTSNPAVALKARAELQEALSKASCQICKTLLAHEKSRRSSTADISSHQQPSATRTSSVGAVESTVPGLHSHHTTLFPGASTQQPSMTRASSLPVSSSGSKLAGVPLDLIARCARETLSSVRAACALLSKSAADAAQLEAAAAGLIEAETLPQAGRWHRRDLSPALAAAWSAVARALRGHGAAARGTGPNHDDLYDE